MDKKRRFFHLSAIAGAVMAVVLFSTFREKPINIPLDPNHRPLIDQVASGEKAETVERACTACHGVETAPLSKDHTSNTKCLVCHPVRG